MAHTILKTIKAPIFWVLLGALLLRLWGIEYGLPLFLVNDETPHVYGALKMIELKTLIPALHAEEFKTVLYYPPLLSYFFLVVLAPVIAVHYLLSGMPGSDLYRAMLAIDPLFLWIAARAWMALIGVVGVYLTYRIAYHLSGSRRAGLFAASFLALSFYHLQLSHNVRHWLPASVLLTFLWERALTMRGRILPTRSWLAAGAVAGLAAGGVNTAAAVGIIPLIAVRLSTNGIRQWFRSFFSRETLALLIAFTLVAIAGIALYPYGLTRAEGAPGAASDVAGRISLLVTKGMADWLRFIGWYIRTLWEFETPLFLFSLAGVIMFWFWRERFWVGVTAIYAITFFTLLYLFDDFTARGVVFVTPILAAFAGYAAHVAFQKVEAAIRPRPLFAFCALLFAILLFGWQLAVDLRYQWLLSRPDTRLVAREWLLSNLPAGSRVLMDAQYMRLPNTPEGAELVEAIDPGALRAADRAVLALGERAPHPAVAVVNLDLVAPSIRRLLTADPDALIRQGFTPLAASPAVPAGLPRQRRGSLMGFTHLVLEYRTTDAIPHDAGRIAERGTLLQHFSPWKKPQSVSYDGSGKLERLSLRELWTLERFGLFVDVYALSVKP